MNILRTIAILASLALFIPAVAFGQAADPEKLAADQVACQQHASAYSGYNPAAPPPPPVGDPNAYAKSYDDCMSGKGY